uniref:Secreted protein n=1 Tax=Anopheles darlingi TaxID=43151 RepID=A0A2M4D1E3_ANODA
MVSSSSTMLSMFLMIASSSTFASSTFSFLPMIVIASLSSSLTPGKMTRAPVLSRIFLIEAPFLPIRNLWCCGLARICTE